MNTSVRNIMGIFLILGITVLSYVSYVYVSAYNRSSEPTNFRKFTVSAEGKAIAVADIAEFSFQVITEGGNEVAKLQEDNAKAMNRAIEFVKGKGVDKKDISTQQYNIQPRYQNIICEYRSGDVCPPAEIVGYTVQQSTNVKIRNFENISSLLSGVVKNGANSVSELQFTLDDSTEFENQARAEAIKKAQSKAQNIAQNTGFNLGRLLSINENFSSPPMYSRNMVFDSAKVMDVESVAPSVEAGSQEITVQVNLEYEIK